VKASRWSAPDVIKQALRWAADALAKGGDGTPGPAELVHSRPWSRVLRMPTPRGNAFLKLTSEIVRHEAGALDALSSWNLPGLPDLVAVHPERGWILMRESGERLREHVRVTGDLSPWLTLLAEYADLQMRTAARIPDLLARGVPDRSAARLTGLYAALIADRDMLHIDQPNGVTEEQHRRLHELRPVVTELASILDGAAVPDTINHGDLHDGNVYIHKGRYVVTDWGDSVISHPFYALRTVKVSAEASLGVEEHSPRLKPLVDAYLEPWTRYAPRHELERLLVVTEPLASINGALTWHRIVSNLKPDDRDVYRVPVPALLQEFLEYTDR
jgi:hypothetical protein